MTETTREKVMRQELLAGSFRQQTFSRAFAMIAYFAIIHILRINFYVGTAAKQLAYMGDSSTFILL